MRRTLLNARPSRAVYRALGNQQTRRTFAAVPTKDDSPPSPIVPSKEQAHPVGPFYEAILRTPKPLPKQKPEEPPVTSQESPKQQPPKPASAEQQPSKPAAEAKPAQPAAAEENTKVAEEDKKPAARRPRKPRQAAASPKDETTTKAKSVPSSSSVSPSPSTPESHPSPEPQTTEPRSNTTPLPQTNPDPDTEPNTRPAVLFSPSLAGPAERAEKLARLRAESRLVAGVLVPPKPEEPDNCCMSGCVNCVWDRYRDEMEEWAARSAEAERRLKAMEAGGQVGVTEESMDVVEDGRGMRLGVHEEVMDRMDEDGGGSGWDGGKEVVGGRGRIVKDFWDEELYKNVPVGIREFMKQEKRLKEKHLREGTAGG